MVHWLTIMRLDWIDKGLSVKLLGMKVDLKTPNSLSPDIRQSILQEAVLAYEQT